MEAVRSSETLIHLTIVQCGNPEGGHHPINNRCEVPKNYKNVQAGSLMYFAIELKKWASLLHTGDVDVFPVDCCCSSDCSTAASCKVTACADNNSPFPYTEPFQRLYVYQLKPGLHNSWATKICTVALNVFSTIIAVYFHTHKNVYQCTCWGRKRQLCTEMWVYSTECGPCRPFGAWNSEVAIRGLEAW